MFKKNQVLKQFQESFSAQLINSKENKNMSLIKSEDDTDLRIKVYQNNVYSSLVDVLKNRFPTVYAIVGNDFFTVLSQQYILSNAPTTPVMIEYGDTFSEFIEQHNDKHNIDYLSDLAHLENTQHHAYYSHDAQALTPEEIAAIPINKLMAAKVSINPTATLLQSEYCIYSIWHNINEKNMFEGEYTNPENILVFRKDFGIQTLFLLDAYTHFIDLLMSGKVLGEALEKLIQFNSKESIEPTQAISFLIQNQLIMKFY